MTIIADDCPHLVRHYTPKDVDISNTYVPHTRTRKLQEQLAEQSQKLQPNLPAPPSAPTGSNPTLEMPIVRPLEMFPNELTVVQSTDDISHIDEIHFHYGAQGMRGVSFALQYPETEGAPPQLVYSPGQEDEREIFADTHEYHIRTRQAADLARELADQGFNHQWAYLGVEDKQVFHTQVTTNSDTMAITATASFTLLQAQELLAKRFDIPFGR